MPRDNGPVKGQIQLQPPGLLGLLQIKNFAEAPHDLQQTYVPVFPMVPWALLANAETLQVGFAAGSIGGNLTGTFISDAVSSVPGTFTVGQREWWYVHRFNLGFSPGGGTTALAWPQLGYLVDVGATAKYLGVSQAILGPVTAAAGGDPTRALQLNASDFFVPPGSQLGFGINVTNAAATNAAALSALITRLPI